MQRLAAGDRVFVILSDKYLKSPYCMYELLEVWRNCKMDDEVFRERLRVFRLPDAKMLTPLERARCAVVLGEQFTELDTIVRLSTNRSTGPGRLQSLQADAGLRPSRRGHAGADR